MYDAVPDRYCYREMQVTNLTDRQILDAVREALEETAPKLAKGQA
jgi:hypothetical protein